MKKLIILLSIILLLYISCKNQSKEMFIVSINPIDVKSEPDSKSNTITRLNNSSKVLLLSEKDNPFNINGQYGKWSNIGFDSKKGWIFGGSLRSYTINDLIPTAIIYHKAMFKSVRPDDTEIQNINSNNYNIKQIVDDYCILTHSSPSRHGLGFEGYGDSVWFFDISTNTWNNVDVRKPNTTPAIFPNLYLNQFTPNSKPLLIEIYNPLDGEYILNLYSLDKKHANNIQTEVLSYSINDINDIKVSIDGNNSYIKFKSDAGITLYTFDVKSSKFVKK